MKRKSTFINIYYSIIDVIKAAPIYFAFITLINLILGVILALNTISLDGFLNSIQLYISGDIRYSSVLLSFATFILSILANPIFNGLNTVYATDMEVKIMGKLNKSFNKKCANYSALCYEDTEFLEKIEKAKNGIKITVYLVTGIQSGFFVYLPYFIVTGIYLYKLEKSLIIILFFILISMIISQIYQKTLYKKLEDNISHMRREADHYRDCIIGKDKLKETRLLGAVSYFQKLYGDSVKELNKATLETQNKSLKVEAMLKIPIIISDIIIFSILVIYTVNSKISVGSFGAILATMWLMTIMFKELIFNVIGRAIKRMAYVDNYMEVMHDHIEEKKRVNFYAPPHIELKDVCFTYPHCENMTLKNINLKIKPKETVAIVGENGSGKTTLVNIISALYKPSSGYVLYDNKDIYDNIDVIHSISTVFQDFQKYKMTLIQNIKISDGNKYCTEDDLKSVIDKSHLELDERSFPYGFETMLSREFDGVELSKGQWQKICIARGVYKNSYIMILDEPTSAIDPIEENRILNEFLEISKDKTAFIITHRLSLTRFVDKIIVMNKGEIVEIGNHDELISKDGIYKKLYNIQKNAYL